MGLIRKPSELDITPTLSAMIYGMPGSGKTTLAVSSPAPVLFDFDGGVNRIEAMHKPPTVQVHSWEETMEALAEVEQLPEYKTIVIDTVGKMLLFAEDYIKRVKARHNSQLTMRDGALSLKGYSERKQMFTDFNHRLRQAGRNVVYVAHEVEKTRKVDKEEITVKRPDIPGSSISELIKDLDLLGYVQLYGTKQRVISFDPTESYYAKNSCGMPGVINLPKVVDDEGKVSGTNDFFCRVVESYRRRLADSREQSIAYERICADIRGRAEAIADAKGANDYVSWVSGIDHMYNSKAVAQEALRARATALGLTYDKESKAYV